MTNNKTVPVRLFCNGSAVASCKANYVGLLGMQINTGPLMYPKGTRLEVEFIANKQNGTNQCRLHTVVINHSKKGMGLTFLNHDMQTNALLMEIILSMGEHAAVNVT